MVLDKQGNLPVIMPKRPCEYCLPDVGIRTATCISEMNAHDVKKGTLSDDESYVVRRGTEPNLLIAKATGLEAFISNGDAASLRVEQIQECVAVPECQGRPYSVKVLLR